MFLKLAVFVLAASAWVHDGDGPVEVKYEVDRFTGASTVSAQPSVVSTEGGRLMVGMMAYWEGQGSEMMLLGITSTSAEWRFLRDNELYLLIDGSAHALGNANHSGEVTGRGVGEMMVWRLTRQQAQAMANASSIEGRVGAMEFQVGALQRDGFRRLIERLAEVK